MSRRSCSAAKRGRAKRIEADAPTGLRLIRPIGHPWHILTIMNTDTQESEDFAGRHGGGKTWGTYYNDSVKGKMNSLCMQSDSFIHGIHDTHLPSAAVPSLSRSSARFSNGTERRVSSLRLSGVSRVRTAAQHTLSRFHRSNERPCIVPTEVNRPLRSVPGSLAESIFFLPSCGRFACLTFLPLEALRIEALPLLHKSPGDDQQFRGKLHPHLRADPFPSVSI